MLSKKDVHNLEKLSLEELFEKILQAFSLYMDPSPLLKKAFELGKSAHSSQTRKNGVSYFTHPLIVSLHMMEYQPDEETLIATILHDVIEDTSITYEEIVDQFGIPIARLINAVSKLSKEAYRKQADERKFQSLRKMFVIMAQDIRCILIKLFDRLHNMQTIGNLSFEKQKRIAKETFDLYLPMTEKLSLWKLREQMSALVYPILYKDIIENVQNEMQVHIDYLKAYTLTFENILSNAPYDVVTRTLPKSIRSCIKSYQKDGFVADCETCLFSTVVVDKTACYQLLYFLHDNFHVVSGQFRDYITNPKENNYQALHTMLMSKDGVKFIVRIQSQEMYENSENGVLQNWKGDPHIIAEKNLEKFNIKWIEDLKTFSEDNSQISENLNDLIRQDFLQNTIFVFDNFGRIHDMPIGSTALDLIYRAYPDDASFVENISLNKDMVLPGVILTEGDFVDYTVATELQVKLSWIQSVKTYFAKQKIQQELKKSPIDYKIQTGNTLLQQEFDKHNSGYFPTFSQHIKTNVISYFSVKTLDDVLQGIGEGTFSAQQVYAQFFPDKKNKKSIIEFKTISSDVLEHAIILSEKYNITIESSRCAKKNNVYKIQLKLLSKNQQILDKFLYNLESQCSLLKVKYSLTSWFCFKIFLGVSIGICSWFLLLYSIQTNILNILPVGSVYIFGVIGVVINYCIYRILSNNLLLIRISSKYLLLFLSFNVIFSVTYGGCILIANLDYLNLSVYFPLTLLVLSLFPIVYIFMNRQQTMPLSSSTPLPEKKRKNQKEKIIGYAIRLLAVIFWGIQPIFLKYTVINTVDPLPRILLITFGAALSSFIGLLIFQIIKQRSLLPSIPLKIPCNKYLLILIFSMVSFYYFVNSSLVHTSSTNVTLINNFAPVFAIVVAAIFWRNSIPYLKNPKYLVYIFLTFVLGSLGSTLIFYNDIRLNEYDNMYGNILAFIAMMIDVVLVVSQIKYINSAKNLQSTTVNFVVFASTFLLSLPLLFIYWSDLTSLSLHVVFIGIIAGCIPGIGNILNYEAFKRIDGFIAFLMFNISIFITFSTEAFILKAIVPTGLLILGGIMIISASIIAEYINSKCE